MHTASIQRVKLSVVNVPNPIHQGPKKQNKRHPMKKSAASAPSVSSSPLANVVTVFQQIFSCNCGSLSSTLKNDENYPSLYKSTSRGSFQSQSISIYSNLTLSVDKSRGFRGKMMVMAPFDLLSDVSNDHNDISVMKTTCIEDATIWLELEPSSPQMS